MQTVFQRGQIPCTSAPSLLKVFYFVLVEEKCHGSRLRYVSFILHYKVEGRDI